MRSIIFPAIPVKSGLSMSVDNVDKSGKKKAGAADKNGKAGRFAGEWRLDRAGEK